MKLPALKVEDLSHNIENEQVEFNFIILNGPDRFYIKKYPQNLYLSCMLALSYSGSSEVNDFYIVVNEG